MKNVSICLTPALRELYEVSGRIVVVVDIFRASSTMVAALCEGVDHIIPVADQEDCRALGAKGYLTAGERNGHIIPGFDLGNSPLAFQQGAFAGQKLSMTTTNGTLAIEKFRAGARELLIGAFMNLSSTAAYLREQEADVLIVCAGWKGNYNLEDALYAGALVEALSATHSPACDSSLAMKTLYGAVHGDLKGFLAQASHAKRLQNHGIEGDIDFCLELDRYAALVRLKEEKLVLA